MTPPAIVRPILQTKPLDYTLRPVARKARPAKLRSWVSSRALHTSAPLAVNCWYRDINMRVKARVEPRCDDYQNDRTLDDGDLLYSGSLALPTVSGPARQGLSVSNRGSQFSPYHNFIVASLLNQPVRVLKRPANHRWQ
jgi:hypothetical protein